MNQKVEFPPTTISVSGAAVSVPNQEQKILVVAQKTSAGTAVSGDLNQNIQADADTEAGIKSIGAELVRAVRRVNEDTQIDAIFLDDAAGTPAAGAVVFTGTATEAGTLEVIVGSARNHRLSVVIASGDTATAVGATLVAAMAADTSIMADGVNTTGSVAVTCVHDGTIGNEIPLAVNGAVAGISVAITAMTSGATDPTLTGVFDAINDIRYQTIIWQFVNDTSELVTLIDARFNVANDILDGIGYVGKVDTLVNHVSAVGALNSVINYTTEKTETLTTLKGSATVEMAPVISAYAGALRARKLTVGAAIAEINVGANGNDNVGGPKLASRPLAGSPVFAMSAIKAGRGWSKTDIAALAVVGASIVGINDSNQMVLGQQYTTKTTTNSIPDDSFRFVNYVDTTFGIREFYFNNLKITFAQTRLTDGDLVAGVPMTNENQIRAKLSEFYVTLSGSDFALTRAGEAPLAFFNENLTLDVNLQTGAVTFSAKTPIVTQLRSITGDIQIVFSISEAAVAEEESSEEEAAEAEL